jgi:hypothetical protein
MTYRVRSERKRCALRPPQSRDHHLRCATDLRAPPPQWWSVPCGRAPRAVWAARATQVLPRAVHGVRSCCSGIKQLVSGVTCVCANATSSPYPYTTKEIGGNKSTPRAHRGARAASWQCPTQWGTWGVAHSTSALSTSRICIWVYFGFGRVGARCRLLVASS